MINESWKRQGGKGPGRDYSQDFMLRNTTSDKSIPQKRRIVTWCLIAAEMASWASGCQWLLTTHVRRYYKH